MRGRRRSGKQVNTVKLAAEYRESLITRHAPNSQVAEAYRMLRTNLILQLDRGMDDDSKLGVVVVTSTGRGEGKSLTCANLALVLAQSGRRVALVDADLRLPCQHLVFDGQYERTDGRDLGEAMTRAKSNASTLEECAVRVADNLDAYFEGGMGAQLPSETIASSDFRTLVRELKDRYDVVIIDTAPVGLVTDAAVAARLADGVLFVVGYEHTSRRQIRRAYGELAKANAKMLGSVLNRVPMERKGRSGDGYFLGGDYYGPSSVAPSGESSHTPL